MPTALERLAEIRGAATAPQTALERLAEIRGTGTAVPSPELQPQPADVTGVDPSFATADRTPFGLQDFDPRGSFGILPEGSTEAVIQAQRQAFSRQFPGLVPQAFEKEPFDPAASTLQNTRALILNAARGLIELPAGVGTMALEDPIATAGELAAFAPSEAENAANALGFSLLTSPVTRMEFFPSRDTPERTEQARERIFQSPEALALAALPFAKAGVGAIKGKARPFGIKEAADDFRARAGELPLEREIVADTRPTVPLETPESVPQLQPVTQPIPKPTRDLPAPGEVIEPGRIQAKPPVEVPEVAPPPVTPVKAPPRVPVDLPDARVKQGLAEQPAQPVARQRPVTPVTEPTKAPVVKVPVEAAKPGDVIGLNKAEQNRIRETTGLAQLEPAERKTWERTLSEAKEGGLDQTALETAAQVNKRNRPISDAEHAGMVLKAAELATEYDASIKTASDLIKKGDIAEARVERSKSEVILDQIDVLTEGTRAGRREAARSLSIGRMMINRQDYSLAKVMQRARVAKGAKLSEKESAQIQQLTEKHSSLEKKLKEVEAQNEKLVAEREQAQADKIAATTRTQVQARVKSDKAIKRLGKQRESIKKDLAALGFRLNDITGVTAEGSFLIGKLAVNYIKEGAKTLEQVVQQVRSDLPEITSRDVHRALIARNPKIQAKARTEVGKRVAQLKTQSRLLIDIDNAGRGIFKKPGERPVQPFEIRRLQRTLTKLRTEAYRSGLDASRLEKAIQKINDLQDQLANQFRPVRKGKLIETPELASAKGKIREIQQLMRTTDELARLREQLRNNQFEVKKELLPKKISPELDRAQVEVKIARKEVQGAVSELAPRTIKSTAVEAADVLRTLKATLDVSGTLRQGFISTVSHPIIGSKSFGKSVKAMFSKFSSEQIDNAIRSVDHHYIREKSGLYLSPVGEGVKLSLREESFRGQLIQRFPIIGDLVKGSERHMLTYLNLMRSEIFDSFLAKRPNATHAELSAFANWINVTTGRGALGRASAIGGELGFLFFAPRFAVSRIQTGFSFARAMRLPRVRKEVLRDMTAVAVTGATVLGLGKMAGLEVGDDPRESDFGKIKVGNTKIDIWAGYQQPMRVLWRIGLATTDRVGFTGKQLTAFEKNVDPVELFQRFARYKVSPIINIPAELSIGRTVVGEETTPLETAGRALLPIVVEDIREAFQDAGFNRVALVAPLAAFGVGTNTFKDSESRTRRDIKKAIREGNHAAAKAKQWEWNIENPGRQISDHISAPPDTTK